MTTNVHTTNNPRFEIPTALVGLDREDFDRAVFAAPELADSLRVEFRKISNPEDWRYPIRVVFARGGDKDQVKFCDNLMWFNFGALPAWGFPENGIAVMGEYAAW